MNKTNYNFTIDIDLIQKSNIHKHKKDNLILYLILNNVYKDYQKTKKINLKELSKVIKLLTLDNIKISKKIEELFEIKTQIEEAEENDDDDLYYKLYFKLDDLYFKYPELEEVSFYAGLILTYIKTKIENTMLKEFLTQYQENDIKSYLIIHYLQKICKV